MRLLPNVTLSPHLGYVTRETLTAFYSDTIEAVVAWLDGTPVRIANPEAFPPARSRQAPAAGVTCRESHW